MTQVGAKTLQVQSKFSLRMYLYSFYHMVKKEFTIITRYPVSFLLSFLNVALQIIIFIFAALLFAPSGGTSGTQAQEFGSLAAFGMVIFVLLQDSVWTIGYSLLREQREGTMENLFLTPASQFLVLVSRSAQVILWSLPLAGFMVMFTSILFNGLKIGSLIYIFWGILILLLSLLSFFGFGFILAAIAVKMKENLNNVNYALQFVFLIFLAPFFPFSALPEQIRFICYFVPFSYNVDAFRVTMMGTFNPELLAYPIELFIIIINAVLLPVIGYWLFNRATEAARTSGDISSF